MNLQLNPLTPVFAAEAYGIDLRKPLDAGAVREIEAAMDRYGVLVWRNQPLDEDQQIAFARNFGPLDAGLRKAYKGAANRFSYDELLDISNVDASGKIAARDSLKNISNVANQLWHSDSSFQKPAAKYSILSGVVVPPRGGETEYADLRAAYDALPDDMKELIAGLSAQHFAFHTRIMLGDNSNTPEQLAVFPPVEWPLVRVHPGSEAQAAVRGRALHARARHDAGRGEDADLGPAGARHPARVRLPPHVDGGRRGDVGQPLHAAPRAALRSFAAPRTAPHHHRGSQRGGCARGISRTKQRRGFACCFTSGCRGIRPAARRSRSSRPCCGGRRAGCRSTRRRLHR